MCVHTGYEVSAHRELKCTQKIKFKKYDDKTIMVLNLKNQNYANCVDIYLHCKLYDKRMNQ